MVLLQKCFSIRDNIPNITKRLIGSVDFNIKKHPTENPQGDKKYEQQMHN